MPVINIEFDDLNRMPLGGPEIYKSTGAKVSPLTANCLNSSVGGFCSLSQRIGYEMES